MKFFTKSAVSEGGSLERSEYKGRVIAVQEKTVTACPLCQKTFNVIFSKKVACGKCLRAVCRSCAPWDNQRKGYLCSSCRQSSVTPPVPPKRKAKTKNDDAAEVEVQVRGHIEALAENEVGASLDSAATLPRTQDSLGLRLFRSYHPAISDAIANLSYSLQMSILNKPLQQNELPTTAHAQFTSLLRKLLNEAMILPQQSQDPGELNSFQISGNQKSEEGFNSHTYEDLLATAILNKVLENCGDKPHDVTVEISQDITDTDSGLSGSARGCDRLGTVPGGSTAPSEGSLSPPCSSPPPVVSPEPLRTSKSIYGNGGTSRASSVVSPDQGVESDSHHDSQCCWGEDLANEATGPLQIKVEETIEEVTTHSHYSDDSDDNAKRSVYHKRGSVEEEIDSGEGSSRDSRSSLEELDEEKESKKSHSRKKKKRLSRVRKSDSGKSDRRKSSSESKKKGGKEVNSKVKQYVIGEEKLFHMANTSAFGTLEDLSPRRVSFPELGADILHDSCSDQDCCEPSPGDLIEANDSWEENWLFKRQQLNTRSSFQKESVNMLIPNPAAPMPPLIGDRDIDELSELSEQRSGGSAEPWCSSDEEEPLVTSHGASTTTASSQLKSMTDNIVSEFPLKEPKDTSDSINRSFNVSAKDFTYQQTYGVNPDQSSENPPLPKPRRHSLKTQNSLTSARKVPSVLPIHKSFDHTSKNQHEDLTILGPPAQVPEDLMAAPSSSRSVRFVELLDDCQITEGRSIKLYCQVYANSPVGVSWFHGNNLLRPSSKVWMWRKGSYHYLQVFFTTSASEGAYSATAYTATDCIWTFCTVSVKNSAKPEKQPVLTKKLQDITLEEGSEAVFECQVSGHPEPRVMFHRNGQYLTPSAKIFIDNDIYGGWKLCIKDIGFDDAGTIKATACSSNNVVSTSCNLNVVPLGTKLPETSQPSYDSQKPQRPPKKAQAIKNKQSIFEKNPSSITQVPSNQDLPLGIPYGNNLEEIHYSPPRPGNVKDHKRDRTSSSSSSSSDSISEFENKQSEKENSKPSSLHEETFNTKVDGINSKVHVGKIGVEKLAVENQIVNDCENYGTLDSSISLDHEINFNPSLSSSDLDSKSLQPLDSSTPIPGTIAEREHRKWSEAPPLPNNPYDPSRLAYRLSRNPSGTFSETLHQRSMSDAYSLDDESLSYLDGKSRQRDLSRYMRDYHVTSDVDDRNPSSRKSSFERKLSFQDNIQHSSKYQVIQPTISDVEKSRSSIASVKSISRSSSVEIETPSKIDDWKKEVQEIQESLVEREVAKFQESINATERQWRAHRFSRSQKQFHSSSEAIHSDTSGFNFHDQRRIDLRRTYSVDNLDERQAYKHRNPNQGFNKRNLNKHKKLNNSKMVTLKSEVSSADNSARSRIRRLSESTYEDESDVSTLTSECNVSLPSVKMLASKFDRGQKMKLRQRSMDTLSSLGNDNVTIIENNQSRKKSEPSRRSSQNEVIGLYSSKEVHSLTARSVPRYFREELKEHLPTIPNRNIHLPQDPSPSQSNPQLNISYSMTSNLPSKTYDFTKSDLASDQKGNSISHIYIGERDTHSPEHMGIPWTHTTYNSNYWPENYTEDTSDDSYQDTRVKSTNRKAYHTKRVIVPPKETYPKNEHLNSSENAIDSAARSSVGPTIISMQTF